MAARTRYWTGADCAPRVACLGLLPEEPANLRHEVAHPITLLLSVLFASCGRRSWTCRSRRPPRWLTRSQSSA